MQAFFYFCYCAVFVPHIKSLLLHRGRFEAAEFPLRNADKITALEYQLSAP